MHDPAAIFIPARQHASPSAGTNDRPSLNAQQQIERHRPLVFEDRGLRVRRLDGGKEELQRRAAVWFEAQPICGYQPLVFEIGPLSQRHLAYRIFAASNLFT